MTDNRNLHKAQKVKDDEEDDDEEEYMERLRELKNRAWYGSEWD